MPFSPCLPFRKFNSTLGYYTRIHYTRVHYTRIHCTRIHCTRIHYTILNQTMGEWRNTMSQSQLPPSGN